MSFLSGNLFPAERYIRDLFHAIALYQRECPELSESTQEELEELDLDFIRTDLPQLIQTLQEGVDRIQSHCPP